MVPVAIIVAGPAIISGAVTVTDRFVRIAPLRQPTINIVFVRHDLRAGSDKTLDDRLDRHLASIVQNTHDHLLVMDHLRSGIGLMGYAQVTDLIFRMEQLDPEFVGSTWKEAEARHDEVEAGAAINDFARERVENADNVSTSDKKMEPIRNREPEIGRNDPCPCGSGKKYKKCCGKNK